MLSFESNPKILSPKLDIIFKMLFGSEKNKAILIAFLKSILDEPESEINDIKILNPFTQKEYSDQKLGILDVKVAMKTGGVVNIEIQVLNTEEMPERTLYYLSKIYTEQIGAGEDYQNIKKAISILICDFTLLKNTCDYHNIFWFYNPKNGVKFSDAMEIHTLELNKLPQTTDNTPKYEWLKFIKAQREEEFIMLSQENNIIANAYDELQRLSLDGENRDLYESRIKAIRDYNSGIRGAERRGMQKGMAKGMQKGIQKGHAQGMQQGMQQGMNKALRETAFSLINLGVSIDDIAKATKLDISEIEKLKNKTYL